MFCVVLCKVRRHGSRLIRVLGLSCTQYEFEAPPGEGTSSKGLSVIDVLSYGHVCSYEIMKLSKCGFIVLLYCIEEQVGHFE